MRIPPTDQITQMLCKLFHIARGSLLPGYKLRRHLKGRHPKGKPQRCMLQIWRLQPMRFLSFLLWLFILLLLFRLGLLNHSLRSALRLSHHRPFWPHLQRFHLHHHACGISTRVLRLRLKEGLPPASCLRRALRRREGLPPTHSACISLVVFTGSVRD